MLVLLVRHGHAVDESAWIGDEDRYLTAHGRDVVARVADALRDRGVAPTRIVMSPLVRAVQTAEILATGLGFSEELTVWRPLAAGGKSATRALAPLERAASDEVVAFVGHEPLMHAMAAELLGETRFPPFEKAGAALIERHADGQAALRFVLLPDSMTFVTSLDDL